MSPSSRKNSLRYFWLLLAGLLLAIYHPLLRFDPVLGRDDVLLLRPLTMVGSLGDFLRYLVSPYNPDFQPVRDLSFLFDILFVRLTGFGIFHLHNLVLWFLSSFLFFRLVKDFFGDELEAKAFTLLFALHPVYVMSVGWISARKHLLALVFLLLALRLLQLLLETKGKKRFVYSVFLSLAYAASVLSQPIYALFPLWVALLFALERKALKGNLLLLALLALLMVALLWLNRWHYTLYYSTAGDDPLKLAALSFTSFSAPADFLLALGRYFYNLLAPVRLALLYSKGSFENVLGLLLLPIFMAWSVLALGRSRALLAWSFFLLMLLIVLTKIRTIFVSDTYVLGASLAFWFLAISLYRKYSKRLKRPLGLGVFSVLLVFFLFRSGVEARAWRTDEQLWRNAYEKEPDCTSSMNHAFALFKQDSFAEALPVMQFHLAKGCRAEVTAQLFYLTLFYDPRPSLEKKIEMLEKNGGPSAVRPLILAALYLQKGQAGKAEALIGGLVKNDPVFWKALHRIEILPLTRTLQEYCARHLKFAYCGLKDVQSQNVN
ncbi:MAG TPA: hypothetical protein VIH99_06045 [Bdellovibrionota bacterium]